MKLCKMGCWIYKNPFVTYYFYNCSDITTTNRLQIDIPRIRESYPILKFFKKGSAEDQLINLIEVKLINNI
jgi:hypothetical protein